MRADPTLALLILVGAILYGAAVLGWAQRGPSIRVRRLARGAIALIITALWLALLAIGVAFVAPLLGP